MLVILLVFHLEISGKVFNDKQSKNIPHILIILLVFHLEISGKDFNDEQ